MKRMRTALNTPSSLNTLNTVNGKNGMTGMTGMSGRVGMAGRLGRVGRFVMAGRADIKKAAQFLSDTEAAFLRKKGDSNPRYGYPYVSLANWWFQPLTHLTLL